MQRVRIVSKGTMGIPMPPLVKGQQGQQGRKLQGGLPPEPYRGRNQWGTANKWAHSDGTSIACRLECKLSHVGWE